MKLWIDDIRKKPEDFDVHLHSVLTAKDFILKHWDEIDFISLDHDAGDYEPFGGDYIEILKWLEELQFVERKIPHFTFAIHSGNPIGLRNMERIIDHCGWKLF